MNKFMTLLELEEELKECDYWIWAYESGLFIMYDRDKIRLKHWRNEKRKLLFGNYFQVVIPKTILKTINRCNVNNNTNVIRST